MTTTHQIYLISDSTGETVDRIFLALKAQFKDFPYKDHQYSFTRTENQILQILDLAKKHNDAIILLYYFGYRILVFTRKNFIYKIFSE